MNKKYVPFIIYGLLVVLWALRYVYDDVRKNLSVRLESASIQGVDTFIRFNIFNGTNWTLNLYDFRVFVYDLPTNTVLFVSDPKKVVIAPSNNNEVVRVPLLDAVEVMLSLIGGNSFLQGYYEFKFLNLIRIRRKV